MRIIFMGTPDFARTSLSRLITSRHTVTAVVTQPDRPRGRGLKLIPSPVKTLALKHDIPLFQPQKLPDPELMDFLGKIRPEAIVVVAYGLKIPSVLLNLPPFGCINLHASLLPKYRGANPIQWVIINGDRKTGVTTMKMDEGWDTGDILIQRELTVSEEDNFRTLHDKLADIGADLLVETLTALDKNELEPRPQDDGLATKAPKLTEEETFIDWSASTRRLFNLIRALDPWPGARTYLFGKILKIWSGVPGKGWFNLEDANPGTVGEYNKETEGYPVRTGDGVILIKELQLPGKKRLSAAQFASGNSLPQGTVLG